MEYEYNIGEVVGFYIDDYDGIFVYGKVLDRWILLNGEKNYIIEDFFHIQHERFESELEKITDISSSVDKSYCDVPLETILEKFNSLDKNFTLTIKVEKIENDNVIIVNYGFGDNAVYINDDGEFFFPNSKNYQVKNNEYKCAGVFLNEDIKQVIYTVYMNIYLRKIRSNKNEQ